MTMMLLSALAAPFLLMPFLPAVGRRRRVWAGRLAMLAPLATAALLLGLLAQTAPGSRAVVEVPWIPTLGLNLTLVVDGLSLFFGLVVSGMGVLVVFYATEYLDEHYEHHGRFFSYLLLFMGAMLGTVFSGNLLLLFVFWELTGVASFLLIGFLHEKEAARDGARMALLVTGSTGLALLAGVVLLGQAAGTYELAALLDGAARGGSSGMVNAAFVLIAVGAFGKSAQFPFHFWLPSAMTAPTPVSAYLHSATMVKLGVFLIARVFPIFRELELWMPLLVMVCFGTMVLGALLALLSHDLKAILACSTISQLGLLIGYYGMAPPAGAEGDMLHIMNHVFYKGCLFMVAGIVDQASGTRDLRQLGGLRRRLPLLAGITAVASAAMAGLPGTTGFISKETMLEAKFAFWDGAELLNWYPLVLVTVASIMKVAFSIRLVHGLFGGPVPSNPGRKFKRPRLAIQLPPLILAAGCLVFGVMPGALSTALNAFRTPGLHPTVEYRFALWHGFSPALLMSVLIVFAGVALYALLQIERWRWTRVPVWLRFDLGFEAGMNGLLKGAKAVGRLLGYDRPFDFPLLAVGGSVLLLGGWWVGWGWGGGMALAWPEAGEVDPLRLFVAGLTALAVIMTLLLRRWTAQLIAISIVGFLVMFYYVLFRAPDLAMTQILVESATLLLVLLLLAGFRRGVEASAHERRLPGGRRLLNLAAATGMGLLVAGMALVAMEHKHPEPAGLYYLENTVALAHGTNAVNTVLVDFRSFDTLMEIAVLVIAALGAIGLLMRYRRTAEEYAAGPMGPAGFGLVRRPAAPGNKPAKGKRS